MTTITVLQPERGVPLDRFEGWLTEAGATLRVVDLEADPVPAVSELDDGVLILGGRMDVFAALPWVEPLKALLREIVASGIPTLGICLGHQFLADALGGRVVVADPGGGEEGATQIDWLPAAAQDPVLAAAVEAGSVLPESHHDVVAELPPGAVELARSAAYPYQAFRVGSCLGVQFHPEASPELAGSWAASYGTDAEAIRAGLHAADDEIRSVGKAIAEGFVGPIG